jgi:fatty acid desaturase
MKIYSRNEVLQHNKKNDCWLIINNSVYNLSNFIASHPGGMDILLARAGEDASSYFVTNHAKNKGVIKQLAGYKIGELPQGEKVTANDFDEPFLMELIDRCYSEKLYQTKSWFRNSIWWLRLLNVAVFFCLSFIALYADVPKWVAVIAVLFQAVVGTSLFGLLAHEATHRNFPKNNFLKFLLRITWPVFWPFITQNPLRYEHNSHHIKIGDPEFDYEVAAFSTFMRYSGHVEHNTIHNHQHRLAKFLYPFYANIITTIGGIRSGFWEKHNRSVGLEHSISILATISYFILVPAIIHGSIISAVWFFVLYMVYQCVLFYGIYVGAAINHFVPSGAIAIPKEHENKYGYYACHNTTNFCATSSFWFWYTGGFNVQIEHHLIPFIPVENLRKMIPIVKELCIKYGYPYQNYSGFLQLWRDHYSYLRTLSQPGSVKNVDVEIANKSTYQAR